MSTTKSSSPTNSSLPLVMQIGFAGARKLAEESVGAPSEFETELLDYLKQSLLELQQELTTTEQPVFLCGISQIAIGSDMVFTRACQLAGIVQRIFLPQHLDAYLTAAGSSGPDFTAEQQVTANELLASPHIIQHRVVSEAADRHTRFSDTNVEIARVSDVLICLTRANQVAKVGGTHELVQLGENRRLPVLELQVAVNDQGGLVVTEHRHRFDQLKKPEMVKDLRHVATPVAWVNGLPDVSDYCGALKKLSSTQAKQQTRLFRLAALIIISAHVLATIIAVIALKFHGALVTWLLGGELLLLAIGFGVHQYLHRIHAVERWAIFRLVAEIARSMASIGKFHVYLEYLFQLPFPPEMRPLLRTISVLHLNSTEAVKNDDWKSLRDVYVTKRLKSQEAKAQIPYNRETAKRCARWLSVARFTFLISSATAFIATLAKLLALCHCFPIEEHGTELLTGVMGFFAVVLPVIAVASLSLAAAFDLEAKKHIAEEMLEFLTLQSERLEAATTHGEFRRLLLETESRLLGETVNWYSRRSFLGIA